MAIIKTGDNQPIVNYYDDDGETMMCSKCGSKLVVVAMEADNNNLVCDLCDLNEGLDAD